MESLKNKISDHSLVVRYDEVRSKVSCARECSNNNQCTSFFYNKNQRFCSLHLESEIGLDQTNDMEGTIFFKLFAGRNFTSKGYTFNETFWIWYKVYHKSKSWKAAVKRCTKDEAVLISPITQHKKKMVAYFMMTVLSNVMPWIGCREEETGYWVWADGTALDTTNWAPNHP